MRRPGRGQVSEETLRGVQARVQAGLDTGVTAFRTYAGAMRSRGVALLAAGARQPCSELQVTW